jgi:hypothetical protein
MVIGEAKNIYNFTGNCAIAYVCGAASPPSNPILNLIPIEYFLSSDSIKQSQGITNSAGLVLQAVKCFQ